MFLGCFIFLFPIDFGTLNPQNAASYFGKTNNCLKLPFLKRIEYFMIRGIVLSSFFMFSRDWFVHVLRDGIVMFLFWIWVPKWLPKPSAADILLAPFFDTFAILFRKGVFEGS